MSIAASTTLGVALAACSVLAAHAAAGAGRAPTPRAPTPRATARTAPACEGAPPTAVDMAPSLADSGRIFRATFSPDGREMLFFRKVSADVQRGEDYRIFRSTWRDGGWSRPDTIDLGGAHSDLYPALSPDGRTLVFASYRRAPGDTAATPNATLWLTTRDGGGWTPPSFIEAAAAPGHYHSKPVVAADGRLRFGRTSPDWSRSTALVSEPAGGSFGPPAVDSVIERWRGWGAPAHSVWGGTLGHDGSYVLLEVSAVDPETKRPGPSDLWVTHRDGKGWSEPRPLAAGVNGPESFDNFAVVTPDGCRLVFVRGFSRFLHVSLAHAIGRATARR